MSRRPLRRIERKQSSDALNTPVLVPPPVRCSVDDAASPVSGKACVRPPPVHATNSVTDNSLPTTGQMEAAMRINPFDVTFRMASQRTFEVTDLVDARSPPANALFNAISGGSSSVETPDVIRQAMQRAPGSGAAPPPQTADIVQRLLDLQGASGVVSSPIKATSLTDISAKTDVIQTRSSDDSARVKDEPTTAGGSGNKAEQPVMLDFQLGEHHVRMPIMVTMTGQNTNQSVKIVQSTSSNHLKASNSSLTASAEPSSRDTSASPTPSHGRTRKSRRSLTPADEEARRQDVLERNREAAIRYRKRKMAEQNLLQDHVNELEKQKMALEARVSVMQNELDSVTSQLRAYQARCTCKLDDAPASNNVLIVRDAQGRSYILRTDNTAQSSTETTPTVI